MKKFFAIIISFVLSLNVFADNIDALTDSAQNCFMQTRYAEALQLYDSIMDLGYSSSDLYYNVANCYYRLEDVANSVYYYEKSLMLNPSNSDAEFNLKIVNQQLKQNVEVLPVPFYEEWGASLLNLMSSDSWTIFNVIMFVLLLAGIAVYLFASGTALQKTGFALAAVALVLFVCTAICAYKSSRIITDNNDAVVFVQSMVKSSPNADAVNSFEICEGLKVAVTDTVNGMYCIRLSDGKSGWINMENIKMLSE